MTGKAIMSIATLDKRRVRRAGSGPAAGA